MFLRIHLLGDCCLFHGELAVMGHISARMQSLLAYLLLHRDAPQRRAELAFLLWPGSTQTQARTNLRNLLYRLRRAFPEADRFLHVEARTLQWAPDSPFSLDVAEYESALAQAAQAESMGDRTAFQEALETAVALYQGDLLPSCYDDWILPERERLRQRLIRALERLIQLLEGQREYRTAIRYAQRLLRHNPLREATYRCLMRLHALGGDRAGALRVFHICAAALRRELSVEPTPATREAYHRLLDVETQPALSKSAMPGLPALVGRDQEWARLHPARQSAAASGLHLVLLRGEAGIPKIRLAEELVGWAGRQGIASGSACCSAAEGELAYVPAIAWLRSRHLPRLDDVWLREIARLLPEVQAEHPHLRPPNPLSEAWQRQRLFEALAWPF